MRMQLHIFFASTLTLLASCGDPQLNESRREFFPVTLKTWHFRYTPGITAVVPFPELASTPDPRFTSSDPEVAEVSVYRQSVDQPQSRALRIATGITGSATIQLFDGDRLVRGEEVRVFEPKRFGFDVKVQNEVAPPMAMLGPDEQVRLLEAAPAPAVLRFYDGDNAVAAAGTPSLDFPSFNVWLQVAPDPEGEPLLSEDGVYASREQLTSEDFFHVTVDGSPDLWIDLPSGGFVYHEEDLVEQARHIDSLQLIVSPKRVGNRASIAVFGVTGRGLRVVGLDPEVTIDGEPLRYCEFDRCTGDVPLPFGFRWRWLFPLPEGATAGTIEARWRGLSATAELEGGR